MFAWVTAVFLIVASILTFAAEPKILLSVTVNTEVLCPPVFPETDTISPWEPLPPPAESIDMVKSFSAKSTKVSPDPALNETTPDALVVPTNCLLKVTWVSGTPLLVSVNKVFITSFGSLKMDCNFSGCCNLAPIIVSSITPSPPSEPTCPTVFFSVVDPVALAVSSLSSKNNDTLSPSRFSNTISATNCSPESDSCISTDLASLSLLTIILSIVISVLVESSTIRSDSPPSDTLIFSPDSKVPITFVRKIFSFLVKIVSGKLVVSL